MMSSGCIWQFCNTTPPKPRDNEVRGCVKTLGYNDIDYNVAICTGTDEETISLLKIQLQTD